MKLFIEIFGWYGTVAIVAAYFLSSFSILSPTGIEYQVLNASGALGIILVSVYKRAYQPAILYIIWSVVALLAIVRTILIEY